jgi:hypothetical protein
MGLICIPSFSTFSFTAGNVNNNIGFCFASTGALIKYQKNSYLWQVYPKVVRIYFFYYAARAAAVLVNITRIINSLTSVK